MNPNAGCTLVNMGVDVVHWPCISQDKCGWTQMPVCHSHLFERLLGYHSALFCFFLTSQGSLPGKSLHWTGHGKKYSWIKNSFYLTSAIVLWGLTCSWSSAMQSIMPRGINSHSGFWHHSLPLGMNPSQTPMLPLLKMRVLRRAQDSSTSPAPGHVFMTPYSAFASSLFYIYDFPGPHQKIKVATSCLSDCIQWISSCSYLHSLY